MIIDVELEEWLGSAVIRTRDARYRRLPIAQFADKPARLTSRQAVFYRNLIRLAEQIGAGEIPVDFDLADGRQVYLDRGCIKIAEHAGFIQPLQNGPTGVLDKVTLNFAVRDAL